LNATDQRSNAGNGATGVLIRPLSISDSAISRRATYQPVEQRGFLPDRCAFIILTSTSSMLNRAFQPIFPAETPSGERENART
jgi:hypothetical protein